MKEIIQFLENKIKEFGKNILSLQAEFDINDEENHQKIMDHKADIIN